jgi:hypothetical protein
VSSTSSYAGLTNGSSQYLSIASSNALQFGSSDYTAEMWVLRTSQAAQAFVVGGGGAIFQWGLSTSGTMQVSLAGGGSVTASTGAVPLNVWTHIAVARVSGTLTYYINGVASGSYSDTNNYSTGSLTVNISATNNNAGYGLVGYLSNVRIVKGTAVYTAAFTPPSAPLTAITNTSLLTLQNATIIDNSTNAASITNNGSVATSVVYPFTLNVAADASGNNNSWTTNNISLAAGVTYDSMTDVPTLTSATAANFAVLNPLDNTIGTVGSITNGNLTLTNVSAAGWAVPSFYITSGQYYFETTINYLSNVVSYVGFNSSAGYIIYQPGGGVVNNNGTSNSVATATTGDVIGVAINYGSSSISFYKNNTLLGTYTLTFVTGYTCKIYSYVAYTSESFSFNFGQQGFKYTPPTGFVALNTYNLPTSTILAGNKVMDATIYSGDNASPRSITNAAGFKPDLVWVKSRSNLQSHKFTDSVRGAVNAFYTDSTSANDATPSYGSISAFNTNGFALSSGGSGISDVNASGQNYVAWQWQAGQGSSSSNTNGSITSTVSVNASAGFSIVSFTGNATLNATVGHGLGVAPTLVIYKNKVSAQTWSVISQNILGLDGYLYLNTTAAKGTGASELRASTSSVLTLPGTYPDINPSGQAMLAYCFAPIAGYSSFGSFTGNGSADGTFVYLGFLPKFLLIKSMTNVESWYLWDTARGTYNVVSPVLQPNSNAIETTLAAFDFVSNGIKMRTSTSQTYMYMAFAANPFKNSLAF